MRTPTPTRCADPALEAVRTEKSARDDAEVRLLLRVIDWAAEHATDADPESLTFGERALPLGGVGCPVIEEFAAYDLAAALGMTSDGGVAYLGRALELRYRLPRLWAAVLDGRLAVWKAGRIADATVGLTKAGATYVDARLAQAVARISFAQIDRLVEEALARFDPDELARRRQQATEDRHVSVDLDHVGIEGTVRLDGILDLADAVDLDDALRAGAHALAAAGSTDTLDIRRSVALGDLARGQQPLDLEHGRDLVVHLHQDSADVARCETTRSPITVEQITTWCATGTKVIIKPVIDLNQRIHVAAYEVPDRLAVQVDLINHTCVFPYCQRPAKRCDHDHVIPYDTGGETSSDNIAPLCRRHHRTKTHGAWTYTVITPGEHTWTAPSGLRYLRDHTGTTPLDDT